MEAHVQVSVDIYMLETMYRAAIFVKELIGFFFESRQRTLSMLKSLACAPHKVTLSSVSLQNMGIAFSPHMSI